MPEFSDMVRATDQPKLIPLLPDSTTRRQDDLTDSKLGLSESITLTYPDPALAFGAPTAIAEIDSVVSMATAWPKESPLLLPLNVLFQSTSTLVVEVLLSYVSLKRRTLPPLS
jgi:hypothetical protein